VPEGQSTIRRWPTRWPSARLVVGGLLLGIFVLRASVNEPMLGLGFLYLIPIILGAFAGGRRGAVVVAAAASVLSVLGAVAVPSEDLTGEKLVVAMAYRIAMFAGIALLVAALVERQARLQSRLAAQDRELDELRTVRDALTPPRIPRRPALDIASAFVPAESGVAGDFFLVAAGPEDTTAIVVGDVVGHGLEAARRGAFVRAALATYAGFTTDPSQLLALANTAVIEREEEAGSVFTTVVCASFSPGTGRVTWSRAGHPPPLVLDSARSLDGVGACPPLGVNEDLRCQTSEIELALGEGLLFYTDGLPEARRTRNGATGATGTPLFGDERIGAEMGRLRGASPAEVVSTLQRAAQSFVGGDALADDLCLLALRRTG